VIEVSDTTLSEDREGKRRIYAQARIPIYWILNLQESILEEYTQPKAGRVPGYKLRRDYTAGRQVPLIINGVKVAEIPRHELMP
jgi:hypothetical protein